MLVAMIIGSSHQQLVVPAYSAAYYPSSYAYPSVYSPYIATAAYSPVWAWGSNKNKDQSASSPSTTNLIKSVHTFLHKHALRALKISRA